MKNSVTMTLAIASIVIACAKPEDVVSDPNKEKDQLSDQPEDFDFSHPLLGFLAKPILRAVGYTQVYPANVKKVFEKRYRFKGEREATLIYSFTMKPGFEFVKGGKLPGLGGGNATTGCDPIDPGGWSMRYMWRRNGKAVVYAYHLDRANECGDDWEFGNFTIGKKHVLTQHIRVNTPGYSDGILNIWLDSVPVLSRKNLRFRGNVRESTALVDTFLRSTFYGGSDNSWAPSKSTSIEFGDFRVFSGAPD
jgi:hypothetical protein